MIHIGLIGCGDVAENGHLPALLEHDRFRLTAVCDVNIARANLLAERAGGATAYTDWHDLLANEQLDAVVLALPPEVSPLVVQQCLQQQLAVLDEKPLAANVADGERLVRMVAESNSVYQIGFVLRYGDWVTDVKRLTAGLGSPLTIHAEIFDERYDAGDQVHLDRIQGFLTHSSAFAHEGSHVIDYASLWNASAWSCVSAQTQKTEASFSGPNIWNAQIDFDDGARLCIRVAWLLPDLPPSTITIAGSGGKFQYDCNSGSSELTVENDRRLLQLPAIAPAWRRQYDMFANAVQHGVAGFATVDDAMRALEITAACELSSRLGKPVSRQEFRRHERRLRVDTGQHLSPRAAPPRPIATRRPADQ